MLCPPWLHALEDSKVLPRLNWRIFALKKLKRGKYATVGHCSEGGQIKVHRVLLKPQIVFR